MTENENPLESHPEGTEKPASPVRRTGLSPKEQKLQAMREKLAAQKAGAPKHATGPAASGFQGKSTLAGKKTSFQRKAT